MFSSRNLLHGSIDSMANLTAAKRMSLSYNMFSATIPEAFSQLNDLIYLYLERNLLYSTIPDIFGSMSEMIYLIMFNNLLTGSLPSSMANMTKLIEVSIDSNFFHGGIPDYVGSAWKNLEQLNLNYNLFSRSLAESTSTLERLNLLLVQRNNLNGQLSDAFNRTSQRLLQVVDVSSNHFTGNLPSSIFGKSLTTFIAFDCCFSGRIPESICDSSQMTILVLDGLTNACSRRIWPGIPHSPKYAKSVPGTIPDCIWTDLRNLTTLQVSGNGLSGTLPDLPSYGNLTDLVLSFNRLSGSIPAGLQRWNSLKTLNLENNKFVGMIDEIIALQYGYGNDGNGVEVYLGTNRLSGVIPRPMEHANHMNIVEGNLFSCSDTHEPPYSDPNSSDYSCGSNMVDIALVIFAVIGGLIFLAAVSCLFTLYRKVEKEWKLVVATIFYHQHEEAKVLLSELDASSTSMLVRFEMFCLRVVIWRGKLLQITKLGAEEPAIANLVQFVRSLQSIARLSVILMLLSVLLGLPVYAVLKTYYRTYTQQYRWELSGVFLSGYQPTLVVLMFWAVLLYVSLAHIVADVLVAMSTEPLSAQELRAESPAVSKDSTASSLQLTLKRVQSKFLWFGSSLLLCNIVVVMVLKGTFVYILVTARTTYSVKMLMTALLGGVDVFWSAFLVPFIINRLPDVKASAKMIIKLYIVFINSTLSSVLAIAHTDASCFQGLFVPLPSTSIEFDVQYCATYSVTTSECTSDIYSFSSSSTFVPVFYYNYNCYSAVLAEYVPIFFLAYCFLSLAYPVGSIVAAQAAHKTWLASFYPAVFWIDGHDKSTKTAGDGEVAASKNALACAGKDDCESNANTQCSSEDGSEAVISSMHADLPDKPTSQPSQAISAPPLLYPAFILAAGVHHVIVMLTFGLFYPPLNVLVCLLVCVTTYTWEVLLGRWLALIALVLYLSMRTRHVYRRRTSDTGAGGIISSSGVTVLEGCKNAIHRPAAAAVPAMRTESTIEMSASHVFSSHPYE